MLASAIATRPEPVVRPATPADAADMARLVDLASEGMVRRVLGGDGGAGRGRLRGRGAAGGARRGRLLVAERLRSPKLGGMVAGLLVGYRIGDAPEPVDEAPAMVRALVELENAALGSWYVNVLATYAPHRGRGVGTALLRQATRLAEWTGAEPDRRRRQCHGAAALRGVRLRRGGAAADRPRRLGERQPGVGADAPARGLTGLQIRRRARYICRWRVLAFPCGALILVALHIFEGIGSVTGRGLSHPVPTWSARLSRIERLHGRAGPAALPSALVSDRDGKQAARAEALERRRAAHAAGAPGAGRLAAGHALEVIAGLRGAAVVAAYLPIRDEIDPMPAMLALVGPRLCDRGAGDRGRAGGRWVPALDAGGGDGAGTVRRAGAGGGRDAGAGRADRADARLRPARPSARLRRRLLRPHHQRAARPPAR